MMRNHTPFSFFAHYYAHFFCGKHDLYIFLNEHYYTHM